MHQWSISKPQGVCAQQGGSTQRTSQDQSPRWRRGLRLPCLCLPAGARLWAWLLLGLLTLVPGAWSFLSEEQEELLVELHNHYRGQVSPSASAMLPLKWDASLKVVAEGYAAKCVWNHNPDLEDTGENLFVSTGTMDLREGMEKWFLEHLDYDFQNNSCDEEKMCGHYTQMVWADTHRVGCAVHLCNNMEGLSWEKASFLVCNYYPAGNYEGERPYVEGDWCSRCPEKMQKCENNLCVDETEDGGDDAGDSSEGWTDIDPSAPYEETSQPADVTNEQRGDVPPPATTESLVQPVATTDPTTTTTTASAASTVRGPQVTVPPATSEPATWTPQIHSTVKQEEATKNMEEQEEKVKRTTRPVGQEVKTEQGLDEHPSVQQSCGSTLVPSLLFACVSGIFSLRL